MRTSGVTREGPESQIPGVFSLSLDIPMLSKEAQKTAPVGMEGLQGENAGNEHGQCYTAIFSQVLAQDLGLKPPPVGATILNPDCLLAS